MTSFTLQPPASSPLLLLEHASGRRKPHSGWPDHFFWRQSDLKVDDRFPSSAFLGYNINSVPKHLDDFLYSCILSLNFTSYVLCMCEMKLTDEMRIKGIKATNVHQQYQLRERDIAVFVRTLLVQEQILLLRTLSWRASSFKSSINPVTLTLEWLTSVPSQITSFSLTNSNEIFNVLASKNKYGHVMQFY